MNRLDLQLRFNDKVLIYESDSDRSVTIKSGAAARRISNGSAVIHSRTKGGCIVALRAVVAPKSSDELQSIRPGSFGIHRQRITPDGRREALCDGGIIHSHKDTCEGFGKGSTLSIPVTAVT